MPTVLVVDDSLAIAKKLESIIKSSGEFEFAGHCPDGAAGLAQYRTIKPDIVLMDLVMPKMDGLTAIRMITSLDKNAKIIVISSVAGMSDKVEEALKFGAKMVLAKPFSSESVLEVLKSVV